MRVLHTNFLRGWGGQSNRVLVECRGLVALGHEVLVSAPPGSELAKRARAAGLEVAESVTYAGGARPGAFADIFRMRRLIAGFQPDLIHLHGGRDSWTAAAALLRPVGGCAPRIIRTKHNVFRIADHFLNRWQYGRFFEMIVCLSRAIVEQCAEKPYIAREKLVTIPSAVDCARFDAARGARDAMRREFGIAPDEVVIAMTGRLRPEKGHAVLLAAVPEVLKAQPNARFLLIGSGSLGGDLTQTLSALGLSGKVTLTGFRNDVPECLSAADVYAQPSLSEGLGTSVLEACAAGLPVAASNVGGIPDVIEDGTTGILTETGNARSIADALIRLTADASLRARLAAAARAMVAGRFSVEALVRQTDEAYRRLLASPRPRSA